MYILNVCENAHYGTNKRIMGYSEKNNVAWQHTITVHDLAGPPRLLHSQSDPSPTHQLLPIQMRSGSVQVYHPDVVYRYPPHLVPPEKR